jgi:hypothetical protein
VVTGVAVRFPVEPQLGGWVLEVAGIPIWVVDDAGPGPQPGGWVRVRGVVGVCDGYEVEELEQALRRGVERPWRVQRVVRMRHYAGGRAEAGADEVAAALRRLPPWRRWWPWRADFGMYVGPGPEDRGVPPGGGQVQSWEVGSVGFTGDVSSYLMELAAAG